jgi:BA14K-like protein
MIRILSLQFILTAAIFFVLNSINVTTASAQSRFCDREASRYANRQPGPGESAVAGGIIGGLTGAIIGGAIGGHHGAGTGAAIGGGVGVVSGLARGSAGWQRAYDRAYADCINHRSRPSRVHGPAPWSDEWYEYCAAKFRSFNPDTGKYRTYSGHLRTCR